MLDLSPAESRALASTSRLRDQTTAARLRVLEPLVFCGGLCTIGMELTASRLVAPYFGSSTFIWANLIGLTLTFLAIGYYVGGRVADRRPDPRLLFAVTAVAAISAGLIPVMSRPILQASLSAFDEVAVGAFYGSLLGTILLFAVPITLLGFVTPFAIRLRIGGVDRAGNTAGKIYALSTVGSIVGSFVPVLLLIPLLGTARTFLVLSLLLLAVSLLGMIEVGARQAAAAVAAAAVLFSGFSVATEAATIKPPYRGELIHEAESEYNYIQVLQDGDETLLALNEGHAVHSIYNPTRLLTGGPWDYFMVAPLLNEGFAPERIERSLMIGSAAGTAARQLLAAYPASTVDGVEIDPEIVEIGRDFFAMDDPRFEVHVSDGRHFLRTSDETFDIIGIDAYRQPYIPFQLTTKEFFGEVRQHLGPCGVAVVNVGRTESDFRLVDVLSSTMAAVFDGVFVIDVERFANSIVVGTTCPASAAAFERNVGALETGSPLREVGSASLESGNIRGDPPGGRVFTDDHAPVELVVDQIIVEAARSEEDGS